jgi:formate dehydrogenase assembly factor FdhD
MAETTINEITVIKPRGRPRLSDEERELRHATQKAAIKEYKRLYYHQKLKGEHVCGMCNKTFNNRMAFNKHERNIQECEEEQLNQQLKKMNDQISFLINY